MDPIPEMRVLARVILVLAMIGALSLAVTIAYILTKVLS